MIAIISYGLVMAFCIIMFASCEHGRSMQEDYKEAMKCAEREHAIVLKTTRLIQGDRGL